MRAARWCAALAASASDVHKVPGTANQYLLVIEAIGNNGKRYFRSWTPLAARPAHPDQLHLLKGDDHA
jgi:hypothetical protein